MKPITAAIFVKDQMNGRVQTPVENFEFQNVKEVEARLKELQKGYVEGNERIRIGAQELGSKKFPGKKIKVIYAESEADFFHVAYLGMKIKEQKA